MTTVAPPIEAHNQPECIPPDPPSLCIEICLWYIVPLHEIHFHAFSCWSRTFGVHLLLFFLHHLGFSITPSSLDHVPLVCETLSLLQLFVSEIT
jgi:hypothetical protein